MIAVLTVVLFVIISDMSVVACSLVKPSETNGAPIRSLFCMGIEMILELNLSHKPLVTVGANPGFFLMSYGVQQELLVGQIPPVTLFALETKTGEVEVEGLLSSGTVLYKAIAVTAFVTEAA